eukprot:363181-Chlamydomonas_euryale.AAC.10
MHLHTMCQHPSLQHTCALNNPPPHPACSAMQSRTLSHTVTSTNSTSAQPACSAAQSRFDEALPLCRAALMARQNVLGADHPNTLASANNLAALLKATGELEDARELCARALSGCEKALWQDHPGTLACTVGGASKIEVIGCGGVGCEHALSQDHPGTLAYAVWIECVGCASEGVQRHRQTRPGCSTDSLQHAAMPCVACAIKRLQ